MLDVISSLPLLALSHFLKKKNCIVFPKEDSKDVKVAGNNALARCGSLK